MNGWTYRGALRVPFRREPPRPRVSAADQNKAVLAEKNKIDRRSKASRERRICDAATKDDLSLDLLAERFGCSERAIKHVLAKHSIAWDKERRCRQ